MITQFSYIPPTVFLPPTVPPNVDLFEGDDLVLTCDTSASTSVIVESIMWLDPLGSTISSTSTVVITGIVESQEGNYTCVITSDEMMQLQSVTVVTVLRSKKL